VKSPDIGPEHHETYLLNKYLERVLRRNKKEKEANQVLTKLQKTEQRLKTEKKDAKNHYGINCCADPTEAFDMVMDPNKKERKRTRGCEKT
jgi:cytidylate kinase